MVNTSHSPAIVFHWQWQKTLHTQCDRRANQGLEKTSIFLQSSWQMVIFLWLYCGFPNKTLFQLRQVQLNCLQRRWTETGVLMTHCPSPGLWVCIHIIGPRQMHSDQSPAHTWTPWSAWLGGKAFSNLTVSLSPHPGRPHPKTTGWGPAPAPCWHASSWGALKLKLPRSLHLSVHQGQVHTAEKLQALILGLYLIL